MSADELFDRSSELGRCELVRGELVTMTPAGAEHGQITMELGRRLANHVAEHRLGRVFSAETGFILGRDPDTVREADVPFVRSDRLPAKPSVRFFEGPPDLAVEVLSPNDRASEVAQKIDDWLAAGCSAVWVVDPRRKAVTVYRDPKHPIVLRENDALADEQLLPGLSIAVSDIFK